MKNSETSAYPFVPNTNNVNVSPGMAYGQSGLTKREAFAMAAMQGIIGGRYDNISNNIGLPGLKLISEQSVAYADALLAALEK